jgi:uncharacterized protein involved in response to NO
VTVKKEGPQRLRKINERLSTTGYISDQPSKGLSNSRFFLLPFWEYPFRPWFLFGTLFSALGIIAWALYLNQIDHLLRYTSINPILWHIHEILFGFASTVAIGFILTACQTWTGLRTLHGSLLTLLTVLWLINRILLLFSDADLYYEIMGTHVLWWFTGIMAYTRIAIKAQSRRNYIFIPILTVMALCNLLFLHLSLYQHDASALHLARLMVLLFCLLMTLIGGRVIPFFTQKAIPDAKVVATSQLNRYLPIASLVCIVLFAISFWYPIEPMLSISLLITGLMHCARLFYWGSLHTPKVPLLWSLHLAYLCLGIGLIVLGSNYYLGFTTFSDALHIITLGAIGSMIVAMMARVSLGHTGRPLQIPAMVSYSFACMFLATLSRFVFTTLGEPILGWTSASILWVIATALFLFHYSPILIKQSKRHQE